MGKMQDVIGTLDSINEFINSGKYPKALKLRAKHSQWSDGVKTCNLPWALTHSVKGKKDTRRSITRLLDKLETEGFFAGFKRVS